MALKSLDVMLRINHSFLTLPCWKIFILLVNWFRTIPNNWKENLRLFNFDIKFQDLNFWISSYYISFFNPFNSYFSTRYIRNFFEGTSHTPLRDALPTLPVCMCLVSSFIITSASERRLCCDKGWLNIGLHVGVGVGCLVALLFALVRSEPALKTQLYSFIERRRRNKQE